MYGYICSLSSNPVYGLNRMLLNRHSLDCKTDFRRKTKTFSSHKWNKKNIDEFSCF